MDDDCFDYWTRTLSVASSRRQTLGALLLGAITSHVVVVEAVGGPSPTACPKRGSGERYRINGQCCSGLCRKRQGKRKGKCRCSQLQQPCADNFDCCGHQEDLAETPTCDDIGSFCCKNPGQPCSSNGECCGLAFICSDINMCQHI